MLSVSIGLYMYMFLNSRYIFIHVFSQSIELYLERQSTSTSEFLSKTVDVPIGEYDGQLVVGGSYCYPVRKFLIEQDGDVIPLELDVSKYDQNQDIGE